MASEETPQIVTAGLLKKYLDIYFDESPVTVQLPSGEIVGILDVGTTVVNPGRQLVVSMTTTKFAGKKVDPIAVNKA